MAEKQGTNRQDGRRGDGRRRASGSSSRGSTRSSSRGSTRSSSSGSARGSSRGSARSSSRGTSRSTKLRARDALRTAREQVHELTGKDAEAVTLIEPADGGGWRVGLVILELRRIPDTADLLANYELELDPSGELVGYRRVRRYARSEQGEDAPA